MFKLDDIQMQHYVNIRREEVINLLLLSIAMEEFSLAHILRAEAERMEKLMLYKPCPSEILKINKSVNTTLKHVIQKEILLLHKLEEVIDLEKQEEDEFEE
jgi:hypothetical protein